MFHCISLHFTAFHSVCLDFGAQEGAPVTLLRPLRAQLQQLVLEAEEIGELLPRESAIAHLPA